MRRANTSPPSTRARARARVGSENQRPWPADKVERWAIDRLIPYAKNARTHTISWRLPGRAGTQSFCGFADDHQPGGDADPRLQFGGFDIEATDSVDRTEPGADRRRKTSPLERAKLGIAEIPVMVAAGWSEAQKRAYVVADNQLAITGSGWDPELLRLRRRPPARWRCRPALAVWWI